MRSQPQVHRLLVVSYTFSPVIWAQFGSLWLVRVALYVVPASASLSFSLLYPCCHAGGRIFQGSGTFSSDKPEPYRVHTLPVLRTANEQRALFTICLVHSFALYLYTSLTSRHPASARSYLTTIPTSPKTFCPAGHSLLLLLHHHHHYHNLGCKAATTSTISSHPHGNIQTIFRSMNE